MACEPFAANLSSVLPVEDYAMYSFLDQLLGLNLPPNALSWTQLGARTGVVFVFGVFLVRVADRRFLGQIAGFDVLLAIVLGSVLSRAINGQAPFFKTLGAAALLVALHRAAAFAACRWSWFSRLLKGDARSLVRDGRIDHAEMRRSDISLDDLAENLRLNANLSDAREVAEACLERNGQIGVVRKEK